MRLLTVYQKLVLRLLSAILYRLIYKTDDDFGLDQKHDKIIQEAQREITHR